MNAEPNSDSHCHIYPCPPHNPRVSLRPLHSLISILIFVRTLIFIHSSHRSPLLPCLFFSSQFTLARLIEHRSLSRRDQSRTLIDRCACGRVRGVASRGRRCTPFPRETDRQTDRQTENSISVWFKTCMCYQSTLTLDTLFYMHSYECKRVFATAPDKTQIPISIVHRRDLYVVYLS